MSEEEDNLAAEYVLGVLDAAARRDVDRRIARDPAFAAEVAAWEARLAPLADAVRPITPRAAVWRNVEQALSHAPRPFPSFVSAFSLAGR